MSDKGPPVRQYIRQVCEHLDIEVLHDITEETGEENKPKIQQVVALGSPPELAAGLRGCVVTPWFKDMEELDQFCKTHIERFLAVAEGDPAPDATTWDD